MVVGVIAARRSREQRQAADEQTPGEQARLHEAQAGNGLSGGGSL
jgi:hypothetical protein